VTGATPMPELQDEPTGASAVAAPPAERHELVRIPPADAPPTAVGEAVLLTHPHVREAAAVVLPHTALHDTMARRR